MTCMHVSIVQYNVGEYVVVIGWPTKIGLTLTLSEDTQPTTTPPRAATATSTPAPGSRTVSLSFLSSRALPTLFYALSIASRT